MVLYLFCFTLHMNEFEHLRNEFLSVRVDTEWAYAKDLTDKYNEPSMFTKSKRGIKKLVMHIEKNFSQSTTMKDLMNWCEQFNIKIHYYCAMD